jgi:hypothetical protein
MNEQPPGLDLVRRAMDSRARIATRAYEAEVERITTEPIVKEPLGRRRGLVLQVGLDLLEAAPLRLLNEAADEEEGEHPDHAALGLTGS